MSIRRTSFQDQKVTRVNKIEILGHLLEEATWVCEMSEQEGAAAMQRGAESTRVPHEPSEAQSAYEKCSVCQQRETVTTDGSRAASPTSGKLS